jgi:hypothetical protein
MPRQRLNLHTIDGKEGSFRTIFKNRHGREIFLSVVKKEEEYFIDRCFYIDRKMGTEPSVPRKLKSLSGSFDGLLDVLEKELDRIFSAVEFVDDETCSLSDEEFIRAWHEKNTKYEFLIMVGEGGIINGLPARLRTRLKSKLHRAIYLELAYYGNEKGVVKECFYYDRNCQKKGVKTTPPMLKTCFFNYEKKCILNFINNDLCCTFTHLLIVTDEIAFEYNLLPLCGSI